jgi:hypothetical protein
VIDGAILGRRKLLRIRKTEMARPEFLIFDISRTLVFF